MVTVYLSKKPWESYDFLTHIFREYHGVSHPEFYKNEHGKPFLVNSPLSFSFTHTADTVALAVCEHGVGLDGETRTRPLPTAIINRLTEQERKEDFFTLWTAKEAYIKYLGESLASTLKKLTYENGTLTLNGEKAPVHIAHFTVGETLFCLVTEQAEAYQIISLD